MTENTGLKSSDATRRAAAEFVEGYASQIMIYSRDAGLVRECMVRTANHLRSLAADLLAEREAWRGEKANLEAALELNASLIQRCEAREYELTQRCEAREYELTQARQELAEARAEVARLRGELTGE